jgi:hypothetical protein
MYLMPDALLGRYIDAFRRSASDFSYQTINAVFLEDLLLFSLARRQVTRVFTVVEMPSGAETCNTLPGAVEALCVWRILGS